MRHAFYIAIVIVFVSSALTAQKINLYKTVKVDTTKTISEKELVKIADKFFQAFYKQAFGPEKIYVDDQLRRLKNNIDNPLKVAKELSSTAVYFTSTGDAKASSLIFSSAAVKEAPNDTLIVNNFGAILRMLDSTYASLKVLLYAKSLCPDAPVILTNLGNSLFELYDDKSAEYFYNRALKINSNFAYARQGLFSVYLKRKNLGKAMDELFKSVEVSYSQSLDEAQKILQSSPQYKQPEKPIGYKPGEKQEAIPENENESKLNAPIYQLYFPPFPSWSDLYSFINDKSIEKLIAEVNSIYSQAEEKLFAQADRATKMSEEQITKWAENEKKTKRILFNKSEFGMKLLEQYFEDQLKKQTKEYLYKDGLNSDKFSKSVATIQDVFDKKVKEITANAKADPAKGFSNVSAYKTLLIQTCKKMTNLNQDYFSDWTKLNRDNYDKTNDILQMYWLYCEQYLNQTYDADKFEWLNAKRTMFVLSNYSAMINSYSISKLAFGALSMTSFSTPEGGCPDDPPPPPSQASTEEEGKLIVPEKKEPYCPFKEHKLRIGIGPCGVSLDCESIEGDCSAGLAGAAKWNYKKKETTIFLGVGAKAEFGFGAGPLEALKAEAEIKGGGTISFNKDYQVIDGGLTAEAGVTGSLGTLSAGRSLGASATFVAGLDASYNQAASAGIISISK